MSDTANIIITKSNQNLAFFFLTLGFLTVNFIGIQIHQDRSREILNDLCRAHYPECIVEQSE